MRSLRGGAAAPGASQTPGHVACLQTRGLAPAAAPVTGPRRRAARQSTAGRQHAPAVAAAHEAARACPPLALPRSRCPCPATPPDIPEPPTPPPISHDACADSCSADHLGAQPRPGAGGPPGAGKRYEGAHWALLGPRTGRWGLSDRGLGQTSVNAAPPPLFSPAGAPAWRPEPGGTRPQAAAGGEPAPGRVPLRWRCCGQG